MNVISGDIVAYVLMYTGLRIADAKYCRSPPAEARFKLDRDERRRLLRYSFYNNFNDAGTLLLTSKTDNLFIAALLNPVAAGAYSFYVRLNEMAAQLLPTRQFGNVIQPLLFAVSRKEAATANPALFHAAGQSHQRDADANCRFHACVPRGDCRGRVRRKVCRQLLAPASDRRVCHAQSHGRTLSRCSRSTRKRPRSS